MTIRTFCIALLLYAAAGAQAADVSLSLGFSQPGAYGRIDVGRYPAPVLIQAQPVWVHPVPGHVAVEPNDRWVPAEHRRHWRRHCAYYGACGQPVYFVDDGWYHREVMAPTRGHRHHRHHHRHHP